jgi:hypothetical protein
MMRSGTLLPLDLTGGDSLDVPEVQVPLSANLAQSVDYIGVRFLTIGADFGG